MTMNDTWGINHTTRISSPPETLLRNLIDIASKGGNYLLNIGPDSKGNVSRRSRAASPGWQMAGRKWLAIYGTQPTLFGDEAGASALLKK